MWNWLRPRKEIDYESILEKLDADIRQCELDISSIATAMRRTGNAWLFYSTSAYIVAFAAHVLYMKTKREEDWRLTIMKVIGLLFGPFLIYGIRIVIFKWFERQRQMKVELLSELRGKQQLKVEELKKKTSYYLTKGLIERYETPPKDRKAHVNGAATMNNTNTPVKQHQQSQNRGPSIQPTPPGVNGTANKQKLPQTSSQGVHQRLGTVAPQTLPAPLIIERTWVDRVLDAIVGENDGPQSKFALVCENCFTHNGLVFPHEYPSAKFKCLKCNRMNVKGVPRTSSVEQIVETLPAIQDFAAVPPAEVDITSVDDKLQPSSVDPIGEEGFEQKCAELSTSPITELLNIIKRHEQDDGTDPLKETLNLSGISIPLKACSALSSALSNNSFFTRIVLSDAFLGDDGCIKLANALKTNSTLLSLDLRGNSIRSEGAVAIANLLKVNSKLQNLFLEWNCLGIWDSGIKCISDALAINESLQTLDLRNNKIGPQSAQHLALCLKHNNSLRKLDLRWNNCGLIGGRAFVDLLQWNQVLIELDLIGNEIPEDTSRSIAASLERNRSKYQQNIHSQAHSEAMTSTIQSLTSSHQDALMKLQQKYSNESHNADSLQERLSIASSEIQSMQQAYKNSQTKAEMMEQECKRLEDLLIKERTEIHEKLNDRQKDLNNEREARGKAEELYQKELTVLTDKLLSAESKLKRVALDLEVFAKDKFGLQEDLSQAKEKERKLIQLWEEKIERLNITNQNKLGEVSDLKDREYAEKIKRFEEKIRNLESDLTRTQEEATAQKARHQVERNRIIDRENDIISQVRKEEGLRYSELEAKYKYLASQNESLQDELAGNQKRFSIQRKDFEAEIKRLCEDKLLFQKEMSDLQAQGMKHALELNILKSKLEEAKVLEAELNVQKSENVKLTERDAKHAQEIERLQFMLSQRDSSVLRLRDELKKRDLELDAKDEETALQMKELQLSINGLLSARAKSRIRTHADIIA